jgi:phosphate starvation-inducible PhoH-like protein
MGLKQTAMRAAILAKPVVFAVGAAGTGKSLAAIYTALELLDRGKRGGVNRIVVSRPLVTVGEEFGHLPGTLTEKTDPYMRPIQELIRDSAHPALQDLLDPNDDHIQTLPIAMMRGLTFHDTVVLVDEAQNLRREQIKMLLTRLGQNAKIILTGDASQTDLKQGSSGLTHAVNLFRGDTDVEVIEFGVADILRHDFVGRAITAYAKDAEEYVASQQPPKRGK